MEIFLISIFSRKYYNSIRLYPSLCVVKYKTRPYNNIIADQEQNSCMSNITFLEYVVITDVEILFLIALRPRKLFLYFANYIFYANTGDSNNPELQQFSEVIKKSVTHTHRNLILILLNCGLDYCHLDNCLRATQTQSHIINLFSSAQSSFTSQMPNGTKKCFFFIEGFP